MSKICFNCGAQLDDNAVFCDDCGARQEQPIMQAYTEQQTDKGENLLPGKRDETTDIIVANSNMQVVKQSKMGTVALIMGILAIITLGVCFIFEILGIIFGIIGLKRQDTKTNFAEAGLILSIVATVLVCIIILVAVL